MYINYNRLFTLTLCHGYFADGYDRFVRLFPTAETALLLQRGKMLFKALPHGVTVLYRAGEDEVRPLVALDHDVSFVFVMMSENASRMQHVTDFDEPGGKRYSAGKVLFFRNVPSAASTDSGNPEIITHELIDGLRPSLFTFLFSVPSNPQHVQFRMTDKDGNMVSVGKDANGQALPFTLNLTISGDNCFSQQVDLRNKPKGRYTITVLDGMGTTVLEKQKIYVDNDLAARNNIGIVEIVYPSSAGHLYGQTEAYRIEFQRASLYWKYFIVNKSRNIDFSNDSLLITDRGSTNGSPYLLNGFTRAYARISLTAKSTGQAGNNIALSCSGSMDSMAVSLSGTSLSGGAAGAAAKGAITIVNNKVTGYTISIGSFDFSEGTDFLRGSNAADTAAALVAAINAVSDAPVSAELLDYDVLVNDLQSLVFRSEQSIPVYEKPKQNIELQHLSDHQVIVAHLPNPSHAGISKTVGDQTESEVYVYI
jgi:hypothetical protein